MFRLTKTIILQKKIFTFLLFSLMILFIPKQALAQFPNPPTVVSATDSLLNKITVTWTAPAGGVAVDGYLVYRASTNLLCQGAPIANIAAGTTSFDDTSFPNINVFYYSLKSYNSTGQSSCSNSDAGNASELPPPNPPENVDATDNLLDKIVVSWTAPAVTQLITSYSLYRTPTQGLKFCNGDLLATLPQTASTYNDSSATVGVVYYYSLKSVGPTGISLCSEFPNDGRILQPPPVFPPANVAATDGTFTDKVRVTWQAPNTGGVITNYILHRTEDSSPSAACSSPLKCDITGSLTSFDDTINIIPGRMYYYSMQSNGVAGLSADCSNIDPGYARIGAPSSITATDGDFTDKVLVTWVAPPGGDITNYELYRDTTTNPCGGSLLGTLAVGTALYSDNTVTPGITYYYSVRTISPTGPSVCVEDPGFALTQCSDGIDNDADNKIDLADGGCTGPEDNDESGPFICSDGLDNDNDGKIDFPTDPGCSSPTDDNEIDFPVCSDGLDNDNDGKIDFRTDGSGDPGCSSPEDDDETDKPVCSDDFDNDGDGKIDFRADGTGDPGCDSPDDPSEDDKGAPLLSPAFAKFNTFLGQRMFGELVNQGNIDKEVRVRIYNLFGEVMIERVFIVPAGNEIDIDVNSLVDFACDVLNTGCSGFQDLSETAGAPNGLDRADGIVDTYGLVRFDFDDSDPNQRLLGRMSFYRPNVDGTYSFAFAREFRNPNKGNTYATANTFDPQGQGFLVPNWAEVIAFGKRDSAGDLDFSPQTFTVNIYNQGGVLKDTRVVTLPGLGEVDIAAGHEFVNSEGRVIEGVYLVEVIPQDPEAEYFLSVSRYSSNSLPAVDPETYNFAFTLEGGPGTSENLFATASNQVDGVPGLSETPFVDNWIEVACVSNDSCFMTIDFRAANGAVIDSQNQTLLPKSQFHFNASAVIAPHSNGSVSIHANRPLVVQSMSYVHGADNSLETGFVSPARTKGRATQTGTINTFLNMQAVLFSFGTDSGAVSANYNATSFSGGNFNGVVGLNSGGSSAFSINSGGLSFPTDNYGSLSVSTSADGLALSEVRRIRLTPKGSVDFIMPTLVK